MNKHHPSHHSVWRPILLRKVAMVSETRRAALSENIFFFKTVTKFHGEWINIQTWQIYSRTAAWFSVNDEHILGISVPSSIDFLSIISSHFLYLDLITLDTSAVLRLSNCDNSSGTVSPITSRAERKANLTSSPRYFPEKYFSKVNDPKWSQCLMTISTPMLYQVGGTFCPFHCPTVSWWSQCSRCHQMPPSQGQWWPDPGVSPCPLPPTWSPCLHSQCRRHWCQCQESALQSDWWTMICTVLPSLPTAVFGKSCDPATRVPVVSLRIATTFTLVTPTVLRELFSMQTTSWPITPGQLKLWTF